MGGRQITLWFCDSQVASVGLYFSSLSNAFSENRCLSAAARSAALCVELSAGLWSVLSISLLIMGLFVFEVVFNLCFTINGILPPLYFSALEWSQELVLLYLNIFILLICNLRIILFSFYLWWRYVFKNCLYFLLLWSVCVFEGFMEGLRYRLLSLFCWDQG